MKGYTNTLQNKKIYIPKSSDEVAFMSLLPQNEYNFEDLTLILRKLLLGVKHMLMSFREEI